MLGGCHGADKFKSPTLEIKICPECGHEIEIFSIDTEMPCDNCGYVIYSDIQSCVNWCKYARLCVGDELYKKMKKADSTEQQS